MQLKADQLVAHLAQAATRGLRPLYTVHGDEALLAQEAADAIRAAARAAGHEERKVFTASGAHFDWSAVIGAAQAMSLFAPRQLIEIRIPSGKPGKAGADALQRYCEVASAGAGDVLTIVHLPRLDFQQLKSGWFTALDGAGISVRIDTVERRDLPTWLARRLAAQGQRVEGGPAGQRTLAFFADRVEGNLLAAHQELQKLALLHPAGELTFEQVEQAVLDVARHDVSHLGEAVLAGQVGRALRMLDGLQAEGESVVFVHWTLAADIQALHHVRRALAEGRPLPMALREARVWGARERLIERVVGRLSMQTLGDLVGAASICDGLVKGLKHPLWPLDPWQGLRRLMLMLLQATAAPEAERSPQVRPARRLVLDAVDAGR